MDNRLGWKVVVGYKTRPRTGDAGAFAGSGSKLQWVWFGWPAGQLGWDSWHHSVAQGRPLLTTPNHGFGYSQTLRTVLGNTRIQYREIAIATDSGLQGVSVLKRKISLLFHLII